MSNQKERFANFYKFFSIRRKKKISRAKETAIYFKSYFLKIFVQICTIWRGVPSNHNLKHDLKVQVPRALANKKSRRLFRSKEIMIGISSYFAQNIDWKEKKKNSSNVWVKRSKSKNVCFFLNIEIIHTYFFYSFLYL